MWFHIDERRADDVLADRLVPVVGRLVDQLRERLAFGSAQFVAEKVGAFRDAGVQRMFVWPVADEVTQIQLFSAEVMTRLDP